MMWPPRHKEVSDVQWDEADDTPAPWTRGTVAMAKRDASQEIPIVPGSDGGLCTIHPPDTWYEVATGVPLTDPTDPAAILAQRARIPCPLDSRYIQLRAWCPSCRQWQEPLLQRSDGQGPVE
jgi:hypothetical protein